MSQVAVRSMGEEKQFELWVLMLTARLSANWFPDRQANGAAKKLRQRCVSWERNGLFLMRPDRCLNSGQNFFYSAYGCEEASVKNKWIVPPNMLH